MNVLHIVTLILNVLTCTGQTLVMNVVEVISNEDVTLLCNVSSSTNITRWTYLLGLTGTSLMSFQDGQCTVSPSDSFLSDSIMHSYACNNTVYQVVMHPIIGGRYNYILACRNAVQPDESGSTWMFKTIKDGYPCNCYSTITFSTRDITEGENVTFICRVSSDVTYVNWNRNIGANTAAMAVQNDQCTTQGTTFLDDTSKYIYMCNKTVYQVTRMNVRRSEHNDMYICTPFGQTEGTGSNWIIDVKAPVTSVTITPSSYVVDVKENTPVQFTCTTSTARPAASVYWFRHTNRNNYDITQITDNITTTTDYNDFSVTTSILRFVPTRQDNDTKIFCRANNSVNSSPVRSTNNRLLNVLYKAEDPYILLSNEYHVIEHTTRTLSCSVKGGNPTPIIYWSCNNFSPTNQQTINSNGNVTATLTWTPSRNHEGTCTCTSQQPGFQDTSIIVSLVVLYPPSKPVLRVNGRSVDGDISIIEGNTRSIKCTADSKPPPDRYTWTGPMIVGSIDIQSFSLINIKRMDAGEYKCSVHNTMNPSNEGSVAGINSSSVNVVVLYLPLVMSMKNISNQNGTRLNVVCNFTAGMPETTSIKWTRNIDDREWTTASLNIGSLKKSDTGTYTCTASNTMKQSGDSTSYIGQHNQSFHLDVQYSASITSFIIDGFTNQTVIVNENDTVRFMCNADSNPTAVLKLRHESITLKTVTSNNVVYNIAKARCLDAGTYYCSAKNVLNGENEVHNTKQLFVNCYPRIGEEINVNTTSEKNSTVTIVLNVIAYPSPTYTWYQLVDGNWTPLHDDDRNVIKSANLQSNLTIHSVGIDDFTSYKVTVENKIGKTEQVYTLSSYDKPDPPTRLRHIEGLTTTSSIHIEWKPGFDNGPSQTFYIKYKKSSDTVWNYRNVTDNGEPTMNITLTGLLENTQYDVIIHASNVKGNSTESNVLITRTKAIPPQPTTPGALIGGITGGVAGCIIIVVVIIFIIRKYSLLKVCSKSLAQEKIDGTNHSTGENAYYNVGRLEDKTSHDNDVTPNNTIEGDTNGANNSAEDSAYYNVSSVPEYETIDQNNVESSPYSTLDQTELCTTSDDTSKEKTAVYENLKLEVF